MSTPAPVLGASIPTTFTDDEGNALKGLSLAVTGPGGYSATVTTDATSGVLRLVDLEPGDYTVTSGSRFEVVPVLPYGADLGAAVQQAAEAATAAGSYVRPTGGVAAEEYRAGTLAAQDHLSDMLAAGSVHLPAGTYLCEGPITLPNNRVLSGEGFDSVLRFTSAGVLFDWVQQRQIVMQNLRIVLVDPAGQAFRWDRVFRCKLYNVVISGSHTALTGSTYHGQVGIELNNLSGDNYIYGCDLNNMGVGIKTDSQINYMIGGKIGTCRYSVQGGDPAGVKNSAGMCLIGVTLQGDEVATARHIDITGTANSFWITDCWSEGAAEGAVVGTDAGGPFQFIVHGGKFASHVRSMDIKRARMVEITGVILGDESPDDSCEFIRVDPTLAPSGIFRANIGNGKTGFDDFDPALFPDTWHVVGRYGTGRIPAATLHVPYGARRTVDSAPINNSNALVTDDQLQVTVEPGTYALNAFLPYSTSTAADFKVAILGPTGASLVWTGNGLTTGATSGSASITRGTLALGNPAGVGGVGGESAAMPVGTLEVPTAGLVRVQWAQNTADPSDTVLKAGAWFTLTPLPGA